MKVTVRTLDSHSHVFEIENEEITVKEFKELIEPKVNIGVSTQRLIFKGKVLQDDKKLKDYEVDECVIHLVERAPPSARSNIQNDGTTRASNSSSTATRAGGPLIFVGSMNTENNDLSGVAQHFVDSLISQFGAGNVSTSQTGTSLNVNVNVRTHCERRNIQNRLGTARRFLVHAEHLMQHIVEPTRSEDFSCPEHQTTETRTEDGSRGVQSSTSNEAQSSDSGQSNEPENEISPAALGSIYSQILHLFDHLLPYLRRYENILHNSPQDADRESMDNGLPDQMAEIFHDLSHAFHAISDLSMNNTTPSTALMCFPQLSPVNISGLRLNGSTMDNSSSISAQTSTVPNTQISGMPGFPVNLPGQTGQRTPVAVAAISTVVQIPTVISTSRSAANQTSTSASTSTSITSSETSFSTSFQPSTLPGSSFQIQGNGHTSIQMGVYRGGTHLLSGAGSIPQAVHTNIGQNSTVPADVQRFMESIIRNTSQQFGNLGNLSSTLPATSSITTTTNSPLHHNQQHHRTDLRTNQQTHSTQHRPHPHHHHHNEDGSVIHPDSLLACQSFHFGPTFHQPGSHGTTETRHEVIAEVSIDEILADATNQPSSETSQSHASTTTDAGRSQGGGSIPNLGSISSLLNSMLGNLTALPNTNSNTGSNARMSTVADSSMDVDIPSLPDTSSILQGVQQMFQTFMGISPQQQQQQGQQNSGTRIESTRQTLREFLRQNFGITESGSDDLMTGFIDILADNLSLHDLIGLLFGQSYEPWCRLHTPLRQLVESHFNDNASMTWSSIPTIAERMSLHMNDMYEQVESQLVARSDVDLNATLRRLDQKHFEKLLRLLLENESSFGNSLHEWYIEYASWVVAVLDYSVDGGADRYISLLFDLPSIRSMFQDLSSATSLREMTLQTMTARIRSVAESRHITPIELRIVLVEHGAKAVMPRENPCKSTNDGVAAKRAKKNENLDITELWEKNNLAGNSSSNESSDQEDSPPSPEDWHSRIPNDWVMIISRDAQRQRFLPPQRPYSGAYINSLPPKRRKVMTRHSAEADHIDVKELIKSSIKKTDVGIKVDDEKLQKDIEESELQAMFETTFQHDIQKRLQCDPDYRPTQHPNTEEYFMKSDKKQ